MRTLNRTTEEFARCHRLLIERTENDPARLLEAVDAFPGLAACIDRLHELDQAFERHRHFGDRPLIVQAHPDFRGAVRDFRSRWATAYDALRNRRYEEAALRVSEEYLCCYRMVVEQTGSDLSAARSLAERWPSLDRAVRILWVIEEVLYGDPRYDVYNVGKIQELRRLSGIQPSEFEVARMEFDARCHKPAPEVSAYDELISDLDEAELNLRRESSRKQPAARAWLEELLDVLPDPPPGVIEPEPVDGPRSFDPSRDSAADAIMSAEDFSSKRRRTTTTVTSRIRSSIRPGRLLTGYAKLKV